MPANIVKTERDERLWAQAKAQARKQYPKIAEDSPKFWRIVTSIFQRMRGRIGGKKGSIVSE